MFDYLRSTIVKQWSRFKRKNLKPIVSHHLDQKLMRRLQGRNMPRLRHFFHLRHLLTDKERQIMRVSFLVLIVGFIWLGLNVISHYRIQVPKVGGRYIEAVVGSPQFINPIFASNNDVDLDIVRLVYSGLMRYDEKNRLLTDLTAKYTISEDKKIYTFELRKDVVWHDEEPFTARDVVFTFDSIQNNAVGSPLSVGFQGVKVSAIDDYTVQFELSEPYSPFLSSLTVGILPEHAWFNVEPEQMRLAQINIQPIGTGPFKFKKFTKDENGRIFTYELDQFARFYREPAFLKEFVFQFYPEYENDTGAVQALRSQKVIGLNFVPKHLRDRVERKHINLYTLQLPQYSALFFNQNHNAILKNSDIKKALSFAVDKDRILREALNGEGQVIGSPVLPGFPGYNPELEKTKFSLDSANELLDKSWSKVSADEYRKTRKEKLLKDWDESNKTTASSTEANIENPVDTSTSTPREKAEQAIDEKLNQEFNNAQTFYRKDKDGNILELNLVTVDTSEYKRAAELIAGFWQEIGIKTNLKLVSPREILRDVLKNRDYDVLLYGVIVGGDPDQYAFWHSSQVDYPGLNLSGYINRNVDALLNKIRETTDENAVVDLYKKFQDLILADNPAIFLYMPTYTYATTDEVQGIDAVRISHPADRFADVTTWYMKTRGEWKW